MQQFVGLSKVLLIPFCLGIGPVSVYAQPSSINPPSQAADPFFLTRAKNLARQAAERQNGGLKFYRAEAAMYGPAVNAPHQQNSDGSITFTFKGGAPGFVTPSVETIATVTPQGTVRLQYNGPLRSVALATVQPTPSPTQWPPQPSARLTHPLETPVLIPSTKRPLPTAPQPSPSQVFPPTAPSAPGLQSRQPASTPSQALPPISAQPQPPTTPQAVPRQSPRRTLPLAIQNNGFAADLFLSRAKNLARQAAINANGGLAQYRPEPSMFGPAASTPHQKNQDGSITFRFLGGAPGYRHPTIESVVTVMPNSSVTVTYNGPIRP
ncbi:hypothetical protein [Acaryochloris sp. IP29b_bin.137]|uniref:hypothetical protein n=1 Tax=Acaryochloris sp. IP29b_bin.137 TaxID=2969217 RepID=UPI0026263C04|nr:hypothetical protein [Acaryochloris sp. IP29b_bin.137]